MNLIIRNALCPFGRFTLESRDKTRFSLSLFFAKFVWGRLNGRRPFFSLSRGVIGFFRFASEILGHNNGFQFSQRGVRKWVIVTVSPHPRLFFSSEEETFFGPLYWICIEMRILELKNFILKIDEKVRCLLWFLKDIKNCCWVSQLILNVF